LVVTLLALAVLQQARPPELTVTLDRDEVAVGEEVLLTIRTRSASPLPIELRLGARREPAVGQFLDPVGQPLDQERLVVGWRFTVVEVAPELS